jgi:CRISPR-associated protein Csb1
LGSKFQRAIVSEVVGIGVELGTRTSSRIDPTGIEKTEIYEAKLPGEGGSQDWTADPAEAKLEKKQPMLLKRGGEKAGSPAVINHGNVKPSQDAETGGVTVDYAEQLTVLSFPALRRLRFATTTDGKRLEGRERQTAEDAARTLLAALALAAVAYQRENGYDLRSRCALRALGPLTLELIPGDGGDGQSFALDRETAKVLLDQAKSAATAEGMSWPTEPLTLVPAPKLVGLIRKSRQLTVVEEQGE